MFACAILAYASHVAHGIECAGWMPLPAICLWDDVIATDCRIFQIRTQFYVKQAI